MLGAVVGKTDYRGMAAMMEKDSEIFRLFSEDYRSYSQEEISLQEYLLACREDKSMYASAAERMVDAIGKPKLFDTSHDERLGRIFANRTIKIYPSFADFFGMEDTIERIAGYFRYASQGLEERKQIFAGEKPFNWSAGELLAYGSLLAEGRTVRMTGQDVQRGTFSHRHAVLHESETNATHNSLAYIGEGQGKFEIYNSLLSEYGVMGYEYGYAMANPHALVIWEAQFGDFGNGAQIMIDQFIAATESKWNAMNGLVMLLPHGYEGQGPEHSSARP